MNVSLNKKNNDTVSVIMAVYNCEKTVSQAIESILNQTYQDIQFIICNDCSTDNTAKIVKEYADNYTDKIVFIENKKNLMLPSSLNHCLEYVTGKYVARMDGDDYSYPDRLEKQVSFLKNNPDFDLVGTGMEIFDGKKTVGTIIKKEIPQKEDTVQTNVFSHATILTYSYVYDVLGGYSLEPRAIRVEDFDLWIRFFFEGFKGYNIPDTLYRVLEDENTMKRRKFKYRVNAYKTSKFGVNLLGLSKKYLLESIFSLLKGLIPKPIYVMLHRIKFKNN